MKTATAASEPTLDGVLASLADYLSFQVDEGGGVVECDLAQWRAAAGGATHRETRDPATGLRAGAERRGPDPAAAPVAAPTPARVPAAAVPAPGLDEAGAAAALGKIAERVAACTACALHRGRTRTVPGQGNPRPDVLFVGEGPGAEEDLQGLAFVGAAGQLLTRMIQAMGFTREEVFIANIVKCRPPDNRKPMPDEMDACLPYLREQIAVLRPKVIVALGATAVTGLLHTTTGITRLRGQWQSFGGIDLMPTFHPAYLLRNPPSKREAWEDLQAVLKRLGRPVPRRP